MCHTHSETPANKAGDAAKQQVFGELFSSIAPVILAGSASCSYFAVKGKAIARDFFFLNYPTIFSEETVTI